MSTLEIFASMGDIIIPVSMLLTVFGIVAVVQYFRYRKNQALQATIRAAIEKGQELPMETLEAINRPRKEKPKPQKDQDLRRGVVLVAVGLGIATFGVLAGDGHNMGPLLGIGSIPLLIGLGLALLWGLQSRHDK